MAIKEVYADCAASAPPLKCAYDAMAWNYANPNSGHTLGCESRRALEDAREIIAHCINAKPEEIAFTPSATAACHHAIAFFNITQRTMYEHKAVDKACYFNQSWGMAGNNRTYAHMLANNETGEIYYDKVKELSEKCTVFTDATAAVGQIPVDVQDLGVAALAAGAHKFGGYPGIGFLYVRGGIEDDDTFPGTPPVALAVAMAQALEYRTNNIIESMNYLLSQRMALISRIMTIPGAHINCLDKRRLPNILSVRFDGVNARELLSMLDVNGVYASAGAACSADADEPSRTLLASGLTEEEALSTIRLSFCPETTPEAFSFVSDVLRRSVSNLLALSR